MGVRLTIVKQDDGRHQRYANTILIRSHSFGSYRIGKVVWQSDRITIEIIKNHFSLFSITNDKTAYDNTSFDKLAQFTIPQTVIVSHECSEFCDGCEIRVHQSDKHAFVDKNGNRKFATQNRIKDKGRKY